MKKFLANALVTFSVLLILVSANTAFAALERPYFLFSGTWSYDKSTTALTTDIGLIGVSYYRDGSSGSDLIRYGTFILGEDNGSGDGVVYNGGTNSLVFGSSVGGTGSMSFNVFEGSVDYFSGTMNNFEVTQDSFGTRLNPDFEADHIAITSVNSSVTSKFLNDINSFETPYGNIFMQFDCTGGDCSSNNFTANSSGTISGGTFSVVPEPVSSSLFLIGGATLGFRRFWKKKELLKRLYHL